MDKHYIDKHEAYRLIKHEAETHELPASKEAYERAARIVAQMHPVNIAIMEQKTGHWIEDAKTYYEELNKRGLGVDEYTPYFTDDIACSECLAKYSVLDNETQFFKHCPNCGAKMEIG